MREGTAQVKIYVCLVIKRQQQLLCLLRIDYYCHVVNWYCHWHPPPIPSLEGGCTVGSIGLPWKHFYFRLFLDVDRAHSYLQPYSLWSCNPPKGPLCLYNVMISPTWWTTSFCISNTAIEWMHKVSVATCNPPKGLSCLKKEDTGSMQVCSGKLCQVWKQLVNTFSI